MTHSEVIVSRCRGGCESCDVVKIKVSLDLDARVVPQARREKRTRRRAESDKVE